MSAVFCRAAIIADACRAAKSGAMLANCCASQMALVTIHGSKSATKFDIPDNRETSAGTLEVVANRIASLPASVTLQ